MVQATAFDTTSGKIRLRRNLVNAQEDDHTSPSVLAIGDKVQISWALHQKVDYFDVGDASVNGPFVVHRLHRPGAIQSPGRGMAYSSAHVVNGSRWILYRGEKFSWNLLTSPDGVTWTARGLVVAPGVTGARPYLHAVSDGKRLHILVTDGNPTEFPGTCVYAGTVEADFTVKRFGGAVAGTVGPKAPKPTSLTRIAAAVPAADELSDTDLWLCDLQYIDSRPTGILSRRDPWPAGSQAVRQLPPPVPLDPPALHRLGRRAPVLGGQRAVRHASPTTRASAPRTRRRRRVSSCPPTCTRSRPRRSCPPPTA